MIFDPKTDLEVLRALAHAPGPLRLSGIYESVTAERKKQGMAQGSTSTLSLDIRALTDRNLVKVVSIDNPHSGLRPAARSPRAGYVLEDLAGALHGYYEAIGDIYPREKQRDALVDFAKAIKLSPDDLRAAAAALQALAELPKQE